MESSPRVRVAASADVDAVVRIVNAAFEVEAFFKRGARTDADDVLARMAKGEFLLVDGPDGVPAATVYMSSDDDKGYLGMLAVDPGRQGRGLGRLLTDAVEARCRAAGCRLVEIHVVNLRQELPAFYERLGYVATGERLPFPDEEHATAPCDMIVMVKALR